MEETKGSQNAPVSFETALRSDLKKFMKKMNAMENGSKLYSMVIDIVEKTLFETALEETQWNQSEAAHILGVNRNTLRRKMTEHSIKMGKKKR
jgi:Fis family transcriptional regulator